MFKDAKVGDKVWDLRRGWGEIREIHYHTVIKGHNLI